MLTGIWFAGHPCWNAPRSLTIDQSAVDPNDVEMLQDLVVVAINEALDNSRRLAEQKMGAMQSLGGLGGLLGR